MIKTLKVYRYRKSGKLVAGGAGNGFVIPLNNDLSLSGKAMHRIRRDTLLEETTYRVEVEETSKGKENFFRIVRSWDEVHLPAKSTNPEAPVERRIDVSPAEDFNDAEKRYIGYSSGHTIGYLLVFAGLFLLMFVAVWGWDPPVLSAAAGAIIIWKTKSEGDPAKIVEVKEAKERLRRSTQKFVENRMRDVRAWADMDGVTFERAVAKIFRDDGYEVEFTPKSNDGGVDLILRKKGAVSIVQCKAYKANVGVAPVRELAGVRRGWPQAEEAILACLFDFTAAAKTFAQENDIRLYSVARDYLKSEYRPQ